ncbi:MAG: cell envelope integrity protein CreD [Bacteroidota bacterium]
MFDVAVYESTLSVNAEFTRPDFSVLEVPSESIQWKDAYMTFSISDLRGISADPDFIVGNAAKKTEPYQTRVEDGTTSYSSSGIIAKLGWQSPDDFNGSTSVKLNLKGSQRLSFLPTGKTTTVKIAGPWGSPSFDGEFLPEHREVNEKQFSADWKILHYNRPFSQQWTNSDRQPSGYEIGVSLLVPVDQYQKSIRTSKYGVLIIILTFVALFLVEITKKIRIHPFQYILIGVALIIYYTLLLSLSEQIGYNAAYWVASLSTAGLISFYSASFLKSP